MTSDQLSQMVDRGEGKLFRWHCDRCGFDRREPEHTAEHCGINLLARMDLRAANRRLRARAGS